MAWNKPSPLVIGVSEATLDILGSQPHGACFWISLAWSWVPGIELEGHQPRVWAAPGSILICHSLWLASTHFLQGHPLPWKKNTSKDARLTDELRRQSNQVLPFRDLGLLLTGHWVGRESPHGGCSWHTPLPAPSLLAVGLCWLVLRVTILRQIALTTAGVEQKVF